ncbi:MAG: hypothetical protein ACYTEV_05780 [Planctomycetota bacterium]|jgi:hypothetical protein
MGGFLDSMRPGGSSRNDPAVVALLERLVRTREPVEIRRQVPHGVEGRQFTMIQAIEADSVIVGMPTGPGADRPLIQFGTYTLLMPGPDGTLEGESRVLERVRIRAGGDRMLRCYRMSLPAEVTAIAGDEGRIIPLGRGRSIPGVLEAISPETARIRCSQTAALIRGAAVDFEADLPDPVGRLRAEGEILTVTPPVGPNADGPVVTLRFVARQDAIGPEITRRIGNAAAA